MTFYDWGKPRLTRFVLRFFRVRVEGAEHQVSDGPVLICANHTSFIDPVLISAAIDRQVRYMAKAELFKIPLLRRVIRSCGAYPVARGSGDVGAVKTTIALLGKEEVVGLFPQGHRYRGVKPELSQVRPGVGMIEARANATILPVFIRYKKYKMHWFAKKELIIGEPIPASAFAFTEHKMAEYEQASAMIFSRILSLGGLMPADGDAVTDTEGTK